MLFALDPAAGVPMYVQIRDALRDDIAQGTVVPGTRLPSSRELARDLGVSRITVDNAYAELEAEGLIEARSGSGTFVLPPWTPPIALAPPPTTRPQHLDWQAELPIIADSPRKRMLEDAMRSPEGANVIPFVYSRGDSRLFPAAELQRAVADSLHTDGIAALEYESAAGYPPLRRALTQHVRSQGITATADDVLITSGAQQGIDLVARLLVQAGDRVVVEDPTFPGALDAFEARGATLVGIPLDSAGMRVERLHEALERHHPRLIYTVPTFHNPTGVVMSLERRREVVELACRYGVPILEDDYVREVRFGSPLPPPLAAFDQQGNVIHVSSFSKSLLPAFRLGYLIARGEVRAALENLKRTTDLCCSTLLQRALFRYLESGRVHGYWKRASRVYRKRQGVMVSALARSFPPGARWSTVEGGLVSWVQLPDGVSVPRLREEARAAGVSFAEGAAFFVHSSDQPFLRLNFAALDENQIERGIAILGQLVHHQLCSRSASRGSLKRAAGEG